MGAHMCSFCNCDPCKCIRTDKGVRVCKNCLRKPCECEKNKEQSRLTPVQGFRNPPEPLFLTTPEKDKLPKKITEFLSNISKNSKEDQENNQALFGICPGCSKNPCVCKTKDWDKKKVLVKAQAEDLGNPYRRMVTCIMLCHKAEIELPEWCQEELLEYARKEIIEREEFLDSC